MQTFNLDLSQKRIIPLLYVKQNDVGTKISVVLTDNGNAYNIPGDAVFSVWYSGESGEGNYTTIGEKSAFSVSGDTITVELILQMLQNPGQGKMCLVMNNAAGTQLGLWNIPYFVEALPGANSEGATAYYTAFLEAVQGMGAVGIESTAYPGCYYRIVNGETEWINPPMVVGEEYRTAERHMGKVVYTKLISIDTLPNASVKYFPHGITLSQALRCCAYITGRDTLPAFVEKEGYRITAFCTSEYIIIESPGDLSESSCHAQIWYTKD